MDLTLHRTVAWIASEFAFASAAIFRLFSAIGGEGVLGMNNNPLNEVTKERRLENIGQSKEECPNR